MIIMGSEGKESRDVRSSRRLWSRLRLFVPGRAEEENRKTPDAVREQWSSPQAAGESTPGDGDTSKLSVIRAFSSTTMNFVARLTGYPLFSRKWDCDSGIPDLSGKVREPLAWLGRC